MSVRNLYNLAQKGSRIPKDKSLVKDVFSWFKTEYCKSPVHLGGKTALITGGSSGIGFETAKLLACRGAKIIIADKVNLKEARKKIICSTHNEDVHAKYLDLASLDSIKKFAGEICANERRLDILINNAGVGGLVHQYTKDLLQKEMQINHFGPFLLTHLLIDLLRKCKPSRIIFVSSLLAYVNNLTEKNLNTISEFPINDFLVYSNSKLCNIITAQGFAERLRGQGVTCNSLHPGFTVTDIYSKMRGANSLPHLKKAMYFALNIVGKTPIQGAQTLMHLALSEEVSDVTGKFFVECKPFTPPTKALDKSFCETIWKASENLVHLQPYQKLKVTPVVKNRRNLL